MLKIQPKILAQGQVGRPRVSANGKVVIWNQLVDGKWDIMRHQDGETVNLSQSSQTHDLHGDLNHDGSVIAWKRAYTDGTEVIALRDGKEELIDGFGAEVSRISVSDDGSTIVYDENTRGQLKWNIRRHRNGQIEQVTDNEKFDAFPFVSADGERIVYTRYDRKNKLMLKDGDAEPKEIVQRESSAVQPELSADGQTLLWTESNDKEWGLVSRDLVTGDYTKVVDVAGVAEKQPQLASKTGEFVYTGYDFRNGRPAETNIYLKSGETTTQLSETRGGRNTFPDFSENGETAVWVWTNREDNMDQQILVLER